MPAKSTHEKLTTTKGRAARLVGRCIALEQVPPAARGADRAQVPRTQEVKDMVQCPCRQRVNGLCCALAPSTQTACHRNSELIAAS